MILARSPYYVFAPIGETEPVTAVTLRLFVWIGEEVADKPTEPIYEITKNVPSASTTSIKFNIAEIISGFIDPMPEFDVTGTQIIKTSLSGTVWASWELVYTTDGDPIPDVVGTDIAVLGFGDFEENINPSPSSKVLLSHPYITSPPDGFLAIPVLVSDTTIANIDGESTSVELTLNTNPHNDQQIKYVFIDMADITDDYVVVTFTQGTLVETVHVTKTQECLYNPRPIVFLNKFGIFEIFWFYKAARESLNVNRNEFESLFVSDPAGYDARRHQFRNIDTGGRENITLATGYITEDYNTTMEQLLLSQRVFIDRLPVNVSDTEVSYKTRLNDKLVNYSVGFKKSFNRIQNV